MRTAIVVVALCCASVAGVQAQTPPDIEWFHIESPHFEIVFPKGLEADAARAANALECFYRPMSLSFGVEPKRVTVRLENQGPLHDVGGFVTLSPFHSVWHTSRSQVSAGTNEWYTALAAHEGRHLIQFRAIDRGIVHAGKLLLGDTGHTAFLGWSLPYWWLEGDATMVESAYTSGGQARTAAFDQLIRTDVLSGRRFSYMKAIHGSYNELVPDAYELGAHMVSHVNRTSGPAAWDGIIRGWARQAWNPYSFSRVMRQQTGRGVANAYADMVSELRRLYQARADRLTYTAFRVVNRRRPSIWTSYSHPAYEPGGAVLANRVGLADAPMALIRIHPDGTEETLFRYSPGYTTRITVVNGRLVWDEYRPDPRWNRGYSELVVRDLATGQTTRMTRRTRLEAPVASPDGTRIAAIEYSAAGVCSVVIVDAVTGAELARIGTPDRDVLLGPAWARDGRHIALVRQTASGEKALAVLDTADGVFVDLVAPSRDDLAAPEFAGDYVLYTSSPSGINNIYAVHAASGRRFQVTSSRFGADSPHASADGRRLLFSDYTVDGYDVAEMVLDPASWAAVESVPRAGIDYHETNAHDYSADIGHTTYESRPYHPLLHLFDVHRWGVVSPPPAIGFGLRSTDKMGLLGSSAAVKYDMNEGTWGYEAGATFRALYPVLDVSFTRQNREVRYPSYTSKWTESAAGAGVHIPLNLSRGIYSTSLAFGSAIEHRSLHAASRDVSLSLAGAPLQPGTPSSGSLTSLNYWFSVNRLRQGGVRDAWPTWGQTLYLGYRHTPWGAGYEGDLLTATATLFVPSPVPHHRFRLEAGAESRSRGNYYFPGRMVFPRGYDAVAGNQLWQASANYTMPLLYPDLDLCQAAYIKKVTANFFFDYARAGERLYRSAGAEALFEVHLFSMRQPLRVGARYAYLVDQRRSSVGPYLEFGW